MSRHARDRKTQLVGSELEWMAEHGVGEHLAFAEGQRARIRDPGIIFARDDVASPIAVEAVQEGPTARNEPLPEREGLFGVGTRPAAASPVDSLGGGA